MLKSMKNTFRTGNGCHMIFVTGNGGGGAAIPGGTRSHVPHAIHSGTNIRKKLTCWKPKGLILSKCSTINLCKRV